MLKIKEFHSELNAFEVYNLFKNQKIPYYLTVQKKIRTYLNIHLLG